MLRIVYAVAAVLFRCYYALVFRVRVVGRHHLKGHSGYIAAANHLHWRDPLVLAAGLFPEFFHFMSKKENFRNRFFAWVLTKLGAYPVDREGNDVGSIKKSISILKKSGNLGIFPEGTRNKGDKPLPVKGGMVMLAYKTGKPIIPITIDTQYRLFRPTRLIVGEPIDVTACFSDKPTGEDYDALAQQILEQIYAPMHERIGETNR